MEVAERLKKLNEIAEVLQTFFRADPKYSELSASYFTPHCFARDEQGIDCVYAGSDQSVVEDLLGYLDIPAMMNGLAIETVKSQANGAVHIFIYDEDKFHTDNLKRLNVLSVGEILRKGR